eukprot:4881325-Amphidinium_carterae.2
MAPMMKIYSSTFLCFCKEFIVSSGRRTGESRWVSMEAVGFLEAKVPSIRAPWFNWRRKKTKGRVET